MLGLDVEGPRIKQDLYVLIPKVAIFEDRKALPRLLAQQEALGERRAMIREERFRGDDGHGAISPLLSQSLGGGCAGEPAADEQEIDLDRHKPKLVRSKKGARIEYGVLDPEQGTARL